MEQTASVEEFDAAMKFHVKLEEVLIQDKLDSNLLPDFTDSEAIDPISLDNKFPRSNHVDEMFKIKKEEIFIKQEEMHLKEEPVVYNEVCESTNMNADNNDITVSNTIKKKLFKCSTCHYVGSRKKNLVEHLKRHSTNKPFKCELCDYSARRKHELKVHNRKHSGEEPYMCTQCNFRTIQSSRLIKHKQLHTKPKELQIKPKQKLYACKQCGFTCGYKGSLRSHMEIHLNEHHTCKLCMYTTYSRFALRTHMWRHQQRELNNKFKCSVCSFETIFKTNLTQHTLVHSNEKPLKCNLKAKRNNSLKLHTQSTRTGLNNHLEETHNSVNENIYNCSVCFYQTKNVEELTQHEKMHTSSKIC